MKSTFPRLIILLLILTLGLAACAPAADSANNPANNPAPENTANQPSVDEPAEAEEPAPTAETPAEEQPTEEPAPEPTEEQTTASAGVSFSADVLPILVSRCINCHGGDRIEGELVLLDYDSLMKGGEGGPVVVAGDASSSYLVELVESGKMPKRGPKVTPPQLQTIIDWINQGAQNN